ncbi:DUF6221 family protein [Micromonospora lupini]|uniref:DUF6221 family protein n=1 Tax=Micromonospora lupini TaxID=285679 RepID=UPI002253ED82|nr:DUF6221 family protein [Micromonospora lupini]MCX5066632.1 DUF6221 family protein [Micromonospora lupini]
MADPALATWLSAQLDMNQESTRTRLYWAQQTILTLRDPKLLGKYIPGWHDWPQVEAMCQQRLAELDAARQIISLHAPHSSGACPTCWRITARSATREDYPCPTLCRLASPYAARPGYREEWRP